MESFVSNKQSSKLLQGRQIWDNLPSSTRTTSTTALCGMSTWCVHMQLAPQSAGLLSPLQNCSGGMSSICESGGAGGNVNEISSTREITWSPVGATVNNKTWLLILEENCVWNCNGKESLRDCHDLREERENKKSARYGSEANWETIVLRHPVHFDSSTNRFYAIRTIKSNCLEEKREKDREKRPSYLWQIYLAKYTRNSRQELAKILHATLG